MTHLPKNLFCSHWHGAENFGDLVTADTVVLRGLRDRGISGEADAIVFHDLATSWIDVMPVISRPGANTFDALNRFAGPHNDIKMVHTDQAKELVSACKQLRCVHEWSTPGMPKTSIIKNKVKLVLHGARVVLRQAGLEARRWPHAAKHYASARNTENRGSECVKRHVFLPFNGKLLFWDAWLISSPSLPNRVELKRGGSKTPGAHDDADYWVKGEENECVIRMERTPRKKLLDPRHSNCPIDVDLFSMRPNHDKLLHR